VPTQAENGGLRCASLDEHLRRDFFSGSQFSAIGAKVPDISKGNLLEPDCQFEYLLLRQWLDGTNMTKKRMVLEIGMGTDIRGADPTKAACRAVRDALWHNSLSIAPALGQSLDAMIVDVHIGVPRPELVDKAQVMAVLPHGSGSVTVVEGGLEIHNDAGTNSTLIANACVVVSLDIA
jgi:uncharacterized protein (TIGR02058 family)